MSNVFNSYIPKYFVDLQRNNDDVITVRTQYLSPEGDVYELDKRTVSPNLIQTTQSLQELNPEISTVYPYKSVTAIDYDGSTIILVPGVDTVPTSSQGYYVPIYFERYNVDVVRNINIEFTELTGSITPIVFGE